MSLSRLVKAQQEAASIIKDEAFESAANLKAEITRLQDLLKHGQGVGLSQLQANHLKDILPLLTRAQSLVCIVASNGVEEPKALPSPESVPVLRLRDRARQAISA